jgi:hypothetical protein
MAKSSPFGESVSAVSDQFMIVLNAPIPFVLVVAAVGGVIWKILQLHYAERLQRKDELLALRQAQVDDYKNKLEGASPDAAKHRIDALEARLKEVGDMAELAALAPTRSYL